MTEEKKEQMWMIFRLLIVGLFAFAYSAGGCEGMGGLWLRRYLAPCILGAGMLIYSRDWRVLLTIPLLMGSFCLGYGADQLWLKIIKRGFFGLCASLSGGIFNIIKRNWAILTFHVFIVVSAYIVLGAFSLISARAEETVLGLFCALIPMMSLKKGE